MTNPEASDPFAHLKRRATERADRTVERLQAAIDALQSNGQKITAESIKHVSRDLEPGSSGLSFQVIRRNARAYALYRDAADAFSAKPTSERKERKRGRRRARRSGQEPRSAYDPLQRLDKRDLVRRIRAMEGELDAEQRRRGALAYDQQALRARILRLETEIILLRAEGPPPA
jgi:hypothetical protein